MIGAIKRKFERYFYGKNLPSEMLDIDKLLHSYDDFFKFYKIAMVLELHIEIPLFSTKRIEKEIASILDRLHNAEQRTIAIVYIFGLDKEFHIFPLKRDFDSGTLWAYGFAKPREVAESLNPAIVREDGLPSDMKKIVRALQKELLISKLKKLIKTKEQK